MIREDGMAGVAFLGKRKDIDMTQGSIFRQLLEFTLPLLVGNLFQQLYNMVDTWVIGLTGQNGEYAAVGNVGPIINILIGFFSGLATGAGVVISQYFGTHDNRKVHDTVHTSIALTLILCLLFTVIGVAFTPMILRMMLHTDGTTSEAATYPYAVTYLTIYFAGISGLMIYNMCAGILRAIGDSQRPFLFLLISAGTNTLLDLLFVLVFKWGVAGVAWATIIAQALSALFALFVLFRTESCVQLRLRDIRLDFEVLKKILIIGFPAGFQMALTAFSNVFVQAYISGVSVEEVQQAINLGGWTTYSKVDQFIFLPMQSLALAATTFVGQNLGVGNVERAKKGTYIAYGMATVTTVLLMIPILIFAPQISSVFRNDPDIIDTSSMLLRYITPFYVFCCVNQIFSGAMRGAGNSVAPMVIMLCCFVGFRQLYLFVMTNFIVNELLPVGLSYPAGWIACATTILIYYRFFFDFSKHRITKKGAAEKE